MDPERLERIENMLTRLTVFLDKWEPVLDKMMSNPAVKFAQWKRSR